MKLDLRQLRHVLAIDRHRNFARAAEAIGLTQPALSRSLQTLEDAIGARIFDRHPRVTPTAVGARLIEQAQPLVAQAREVERDLELMIGLSGGLLRIGAGPFPADISVGTAIGRLVQRWPKIVIDLSVGDWPELTRRVVAGELELVIAETSLAEDDERLAVEPLPRHKGEFYCRAGHPLAARSDLTLDGLKPFPLVITSLPPRLFSHLGRSVSPLRSDLPDGVAAAEIRTENVALARQVVLESDAVSVALPRQIEADLALGRLVLLPLDLPWLTTAYGIIRLAHRTPSPAAVEFLELLREVEGAL
jgi:DNA-binding transcriptional LysR family regulator